MLIRQVAALRHVKKIKTLIKHLCSQIISDSVAVEIFPQSRMCYFFETRCISSVGIENVTHSAYLAAACVNKFVTASASKRRRGDLSRLNST